MFCKGTDQRQMLKDGGKRYLNMAQDITESDTVVLKDILIVETTNSGIVNMV